MISSNLTVRHLQPQEYPLWNAFVEQSPQGSDFCCSWWLEAVSNNNFQIAACFDREILSAGMPLPYDEQGRVNLPYLTRTLGVLYRPKEQESEYQYLSKQRGWITKLLEIIPLENFVQTCAHHNFIDWLPFRWRGFHQTIKYTYIFDYKDKEGRYQEIQLRESIRRSNAKAVKNGIALQESDHLITFYKMAELTYSRQNINLNITYPQLELLDKAIVENGNRKIFFATDNTGRVHAAIYIYYNKKYAYLLLSGGDPQLRDLGGHTFILSEALSYFRERTEQINFGGSNIRSIEEHIRGFGGRLTPTFHIFNPQLLYEENGIMQNFKKGGKHIVKGLTEIIKRLKSRF